MFSIIANLHWGNWAPDRILTYNLLIGWQVLQPLCNNQLGKVDFCGGIFAERHDVMQKGPRVRDPWVPDDHFWAEVLCPICVFVCVTHCVIVSFSECGCVWVSVSLGVCVCACVWSSASRARLESDAKNLLKNGQPSVYSFYPLWKLLLYLVGLGSCAWVWIPCDASRQLIFSSFLNNLPRIVCRLDLIERHTILKAEDAKETHFKGDYFGAVLFEWKDNLGLRKLLLL